MSPIVFVPALMLASALSYHAALWLEPVAVWLVAGSCAALCALTGAPTVRIAFYGGLGAALLIFVPQLWFIAEIFRSFSALLFLCLSVWAGIFCATLHRVRHRWGGMAALGMAPLLWMGLEFFRSEVWWLRFAWLTNGFALPAAKMGWLFASLGVYGSGALLMLAGAALVFLKRRPVAIAVWALLPLLLLPGRYEAASSASLRITGVQFEEARGQVMLDGLEAARQAYPDTSVFVLPEYSFTREVPQLFSEWCLANKVWLIAGGRDVNPDLKAKDRFKNYYNTLWVVDPAGATVHRQAKSVPIQFFDDGKPAPSQEVWTSPWGRIGLCICYDQNYSRVCDALADKSMQALIIPTMDLKAWGAHQHWLAARLGVTRAVEYGVPVIRVASSGLSLLLDSSGAVLASGSMPGQGEIVSAVIPLSKAPRKPWDRLPAWGCVALAGGLVIWALGSSLHDQWRQRTLGRE